MQLPDYNGMLMQAGGSIADMIRAARASAQQQQTLKSIIGTYQPGTPGTPAIQNPDMAGPGGAPNPAANMDALALGDPGNITQPSSPAQLPGANNVAATPGTPGGFQGGMIGNSGPQAQMMQRLAPVLQSMQPGDAMKIALPLLLQSMQAPEEKNLAQGDIAYHRDSQTGTLVKDLSNPKDERTQPEKLADAMGLTGDDKNKFILGGSDFTSNQIKSREADLAAGRLGVERGQLGVAQAKLNQDNAAPPVMIGYTGPNGEETQTAASWDKRRGMFIDASSMQPIANPQNLRVIGNATGGGRSAVIAGRTVTSALDAASDLQNLSGADVNGNMGLFGTLGATPLNALKRSTLTTQQQQDVQTTMAGMSKAIAQLESGGMQTSDAVLKSIDALAPQLGDTQLTVMRKLGSYRQQVSNAIDGALASSMYSPQQKQLLTKTKQQLESSIPWLPKDVQGLENAGKGGTSMRDVFGAKLRVPPAAAVPAAQQNAPSQPPAPSGVDPQTWQFMTPQERALWQK